MEDGDTGCILSDPCSAGVHTCGKDEYCVNHAVGEYHCEVIDSRLSVDVTVPLTMYVHPYSAHLVTLATAMSAVLTQIWMVFPVSFSQSAVMTPYALW